MTAHPWYKRYPMDFIHGTMGLTLEEKGAYSLCLDLMYERDGPIPDDARWIAGVCGCSLRKWKAIRARLIAIGKLAAVDGQLTNGRTDKELESRANISRTRAKSGAKGGESKGGGAEQTTKPNRINGTGQPSACRRATPDSDSRVQSPDQKRKGEGAAWAADGPRGSIGNVSDRPTLVFDGRVIHLAATDYAAWRDRYHHIPDMMAELQKADDYYAETPPKDGKWFFPVSRWLARAHTEAGQALREEPDAAILDANRRLMAKRVKAGARILGLHAYDDWYVREQLVGTGYVTPAEARAAGYDIEGPTA